MSSRDSWYWKKMNPRDGCTKRSEAMMTVKGLKEAARVGASDEEEEVREAVAGAEADRRRVRPGREVARVRAHSCVPRIRLRIVRRIRLPNTQ